MKINGIKISAWIMAILLIGISVTLIAFIIGIPIYFLWNWLMPVLFGLPKITIFQAFGLWIFVWLFKEIKTPTTPNINKDELKKSEKPRSFSVQNWMDLITKKYEA